MKTSLRSIILCLTLTLGLGVTEVALGNSLIELSPNLPEDPLAIAGTTVGDSNQNCGDTPSEPQHEIQMTQQFPYLRFILQSEGEPVLLIDGPGGRFCVLADNYSGNNPEISGLWDAGNYYIYVGNRTPGNTSYTLKITEKPD